MREPRHASSEIKGSIRHAKAGGPRVLEAGGNWELDPVNAIWGSGPTDVYAAAWDDPGRGLLHSNGDGTWTHEELRDRRLKAVWGSSAKDVYVAGNDAIYHRQDDGSWKREHSGMRGAVTALWGSSAKDVWATGAYGQVFRSKGDGTWTTSSVGDEKTLLLAIWGSAAADVYVGGGDGAVFHVGVAGTFERQSVGVHDNVTSIWGSGSKDIYAVAGGLFHSAGDGHWEPVVVDGLGTRGSALWGDGRGTLWVGAYDGKLFTRRDGKWSMTRDQGSGTYQALWGTGDDLYIGISTYFAANP